MEIFQVPCSPPPIVEELEKATEEIVEKRHKDGDSVSGESSSSGRYFIACSKCIIAHMVDSFYS